VPQGRSTAAAPGRRGALKVVAKAIADPVNADRVGIKRVFSFGNGKADGDASMKTSLGGMARRSVPASAPLLDMVSVTAVAAVVHGLPRVPPSANMLAGASTQL